MADSERCRATGARYARLASLSENAETRRSYWELERLWLEIAVWADKLNLEDDSGARRRLNALVEQAGQVSQATARLH